ncbi:hypothetical protein HYH03_006339 [Edaphochlamys debaryana]|uniref:Uncharacterized protein n=1 Tax=Edaphochlamys debaryana TaxID=47281 RepID=A0A835Y606_9CHLO|nr:hypothetical protein HYH03_006339 [Edaphochlamys debaryana]|eukprot:KAG2495742.1 hypothetical protein HYH03_006339 [Edaphochlamys debaryana]
MPRELVTIQVGQCGNQVGCRFWELALREHAAYNVKGVYDEALSSFFRNVDTRVEPPQNLPVGDGRGPIRTLKARSVIVDMECGVINEMLKGPLGEVLDTRQLVSDVSGAGNNWAHGHHCYGPQYHDAILDKIRLTTEDCDSLQSFMLLHSLGGGTGSGVGTYIVQMLADEFPGVFRFTGSVFPSEEDDVVTSPYNALLALHTLVEAADCVLPIENQALIEIVNRGEKAAGKEGDASAGAGAAAGGRGSTSKPFDAMNGVAASMLLHMTASVRFEGPLNVDLNDITMNLVPYPKMHFLLSSMSPLTPPPKEKDVGRQALASQPRTLDQVFGEVFSRENQLIRADPRHGTYLACGLIARGPTATIADINRNVARLRPQLKMVHWNSEGFKLGICSTPPVGCPFGLLCLANNTAIAGTFQTMRERFDKLYKRRFYTHHYEQYMDIAGFAEAAEAVGELTQQYAALEGATQAPPVTRLRPRGLSFLPRGAPNLRRFFDKVTKQHDAAWSPSKDGPRFLDAVLEYDDPIDLLYRLTHPSEAGAARLKSALMDAGSPGRIATHVVPLLRLLGSDQLSGSTCRAPLLQLLEALYRVPGLLGCVEAAVKASAVADPAPVGWWLLVLASQVEEVRRSADVLRLAELLQSHGGDATKVAQQLKVVLAGAAAAAEAAATAGGSTGSKTGAGGVALEDLLLGPGGRHDNDHVDYRSITVLPTSEEALCLRQPYLPRTAGGSDTEAAPAGAPSDPQAALLDRHYRLLREDFVLPLRQSLALMGFRKDPSSSSNAPAPGSNVTKAQLERNVYPLLAVAGAALNPRPVVMREDYWSQYGGTLPSDALVAIARRPANTIDADTPFTPLLFGIITRRDPKEMAAVADAPMLGISFDRRTQGAEALLQELGRGAALAGEELVLVQVSSNYLSVRPVLSVLQAMPGVPLAEELVLGEHPQAVTYLPPDAASEELERLEASGMRLDPSQAESLRQCLSQRVALVQGPPGTGKTFVGVLLCDAILRLSQGERILVVCYTNHALDQFLEALLDKDITDIVRVGGRSKSQRLQPYNLRELTGPNNMSRPRLDDVAFRRVKALRQEADDLEGEIERLQDKLRVTAGVRAVDDDDDFIFINLWGELEDLLEEEHEEAHEQISDADAWERWLCGYSSADPDVSYVQDRKERKKAKEKLGVMEYEDAKLRVYSRVLEGPPRGSGGAAAGGDKDVWGLPLPKRLDLAASWLRERRGRWAAELASALTRSGEVMAEIRTLYDGPARTVLSRARVIGCTTTGAAMAKELLRDPAVDPGVVLVEEAGELLEAHVLTSISARTKQLILIGDHKQLRPKVESYSLTVQSGAGHDLNVSLFERLVLGGFPHTQLGVQHRMHPQISALVRPTYSDLRDADSTLAHPPVRGLPPGQRVAFVDHRQPEAGEKEAGVWGMAAAAAGVSKVNMHEVALAVETVRYLLQQGYAPEQLVLLTPYLGQLLELQRALSEQSLQVLLDELDLRDLRAAASAQALSSLEDSAGVGIVRKGRGGGADGGKGGVRVATIDNYQGEEADMVVASLVRSNASGGVGFLSEPERINVLLSRARQGMVLIGNSDTLRNAKSPEARRHWGRVLRTLEAEGFVAPGLPACCQQHGTRQLLIQPPDFARLAPDGGCTQPCHVVLSCGHPCMLRCHSYDPEHERVRCKAPVLDTCSKGHTVTRQCSQSPTSVACPTCMEIRRIEEEERKKAAELADAADKARRDADVEAALLKAQISRLRQQQAGLEEAARARQAAVELELKKERLAKEVDLQEKFGRLEAAEWEREQRQRSEEQLRAMEAEAEQRLAARAEEEAARLQAEREEEQQRRAEIEAAARQLKQVEAGRDRELQAIANDRRRLGEQAEQQRASAEAEAAGSGATYRTMAAWKQALVAAAKAEHPAGLESLRVQLRAAAGPSADAAKDTASTLDQVFRKKGLGARVTLCALQPAAGQPAAGDANQSSGASVKRGITLLKEEKWLEAYKFFKALADQPPAQEDSAVAAAFASLCSAKLGLPAPDPALASAFKKLKRPKPGATAPTPSAAGASSTPTPPAGSSSAAAAAATASATAPAAAAYHPAQHLADALAATSRRTPAGSAQAEATGAALAFLLHHDSAALPSSLHNLALGIFRDGALALMVPTQAIPSRSSSDASGGGGGDADVLQPKWEAWAKKSPSMAQLMALTGLAPVKRAMVELAAAVELDKERGRPLGAKQYNVARIYAGLLKELGVLPGAEVVETSGSELLTGGVSKLKEQLKKLDKGGVLFLDEAYQLNPKTNPMGAQVLDYLLPEMENQRGKLVVVLAGYRKQMDDLMAHNEGLPSRFAQEFTFPDYSDDELHTIFKNLIESDKAPRFTLADPRHLRIAARRLGRGRGMTGFGNARAVRNTFEAAQRRQAARVLAERDAGGQPDPLRLEREDLLGPRHLDASGCAALRELRGMRGLAAVKQQVDDLLGLIATNAELEEAEQPPKQVNLNRIFLGNPGTGKTTVAGLYGRILRDLGLLSKGDVVVKVPADFVGTVLGESEKKTEAILEASKGCVLVIDEAYGLYWDGGRDPYREAVIDTIVARVQGVPGDDRCVLLLGYEEQMEAMLRKSNPGLARRFQLPQAWRFEDYGPEDLLAIIREAARKRGWALGEGALLAAVDALEAERRKPNFGNAGAVNNLLSVAAVRMEARLRGMPPEQRARAAPVAEDFLPPGAGGDPADIFGDLVGCRAVLQKLREWQATITACQALGRDPLQAVELNFRFTGAPGTGKTTVARRVGKLFASLGLLGSAEMVSCSASDFVTGYANQASGKTRELFKKAVGGVLFIDEAYRLNPRKGGPMMAEVLDEIVQLLTEPAFKDKMVVILAGYDNEIEELMAVNPGLKSRFSQVLHFPDFSAEDAAALLRQQLGRDGLELAAEVTQEALVGMAQQLASAPNWANGRDVGTWAKRAFTQHALALGQGQQGPAAGGGVGLAALRAALEDMLRDKAPKAPSKAAAGTGGGAAAAGSGASPAGGDVAGSMSHDAPQQQAFATAQPLPPPPTTAAVAAPAVRVEEPVVETETAVPPAAEAPDGPGSFGGLSNAFLSAMQDALEGKGHDLTSLDAVRELALDPALAEEILPYMSAMPGVDAATLAEMVRQWQIMIRERMEEEAELARKRQRPVWRCAVCGRYGCPVAPYIERYEEV